MVEVNKNGLTVLFMMGFGEMITTHAEVNIDKHMEPFTIETCFTIRLTSQAKKYQQKQRGKPKDKKMLTK